MKLILIFAMLAVTIPGSDPTFERSPQGWLPHCPAGTDLIREIPSVCFWGTAPMPHKPVQDQFKCVDVGMIPQGIQQCVSMDE